MRTGPFRNITPALGLIVFCYLLVSCQKDIIKDHATGNANLQIHFKAMVDGDGLIFGKMYKNVFAEAYSVKTFKFYVHGIELINSQTNTIYRTDQSDHYLVNAADSAASYLQLSIPTSSYDRIGFIIGVDSTRNTSGAQTGALDPAKGMFWTWSTGYIMARLEGNSPVAATPNNVIEYHIGGFKGTESVLRKVILNFPAGQKVDLRQTTHSVITISANINSWFNPNPIRISQMPVSMTPGSLATQIADNYANMFTVERIINE